jgi:uncharacterized membrane protein YdbT with pleckstrin-like domain
VGYIDSSLLPGERVVARAHLHPVVYARAAAVALTGALLLVLADTIGLPAVVGAVAVAAGLLLAVSPWIEARTSEFGVTDKRVVIKTGFVRRRTLELLLRQIEAISVDQTVTGRILNYGTVSLSGTGGVKETFHAIARPLEFRRAIQAQSVARDHGGDPAVPSA